jgi:hypothetical protein
MSVLLVLFYKRFFKWEPYLEKPVFRIRIHKFLGLPDTDPFVRGMDPDPSISKQK